jgi:thiol-disulfide isomerase/thioredoxin
MRTTSHLRLLLVLVGAGVGWAAERPGRAGLLEARWQQLDRDGDGRLTRVEAGEAGWFERIDRDGDGVVTRAEVSAVARVLGRAGAAGADRRPTSAAVVEEGGTDGGHEGLRVGPRVLKRADANVGRLMPDITFTDLAGRPGRLSDFKGARAVVIALTSTSCPLTRKYAPSLARIEEEYARRGVVFVFVNPTATDAAEDIRATIAETGLRGRYVHDTEGRVARALEAKTTTEMFVLDAARTLVFRGAVDDQYGLGYALDAPRETYLRDALEAVLAGREPEPAATEAPGCALDLGGDVAGGSAGATPDGAAATGSITYHNRISRIVQNNCLECHRPGGVGPFSLATYEDVRSHAGMMRRQVARGAMPPWFAAPPEPGAASHWRNDRSLAAADKADLLAWLAGDKPVGDPAEAPLPREFPEGWSIGEPDVVLELPRAVAIKAEGVMPYQTLRVETTFAEDKWVQAYEVRPTARAVVHHVIVKVHAKGAKLRAEGGAAGEREGFFAAYVPGNAYAIFPRGFAKKIPAGATVSFQMHYTPNGRATTDRTRLGLIFAAEPPRHAVQVVGLANPRLRIPPGAPRHAETTSVTLPAAATLLGLLPHMHVRGTAARYEAILPDGTRRMLLDVPRYDFNWQLPYRFAEPPTLPRGTRLVYTAWYDNSAGNPANPDPTKLVRWGPQTFDEMMLGYVEYYLPN